MSAYRSYVICTSPRSGSTLLCKLLAANNISGKPESYFHDPSLSSWLRYHGLNNETFKDERTSLAAVFEAARQKGTAGTGQFGLRLQGRSRGYFLKQLRLLHPQHSNDVARIEAAFGRCLIIHLTRSDKLGQAISFVKAQQTGLWHKNADGSELERLAPPARPVFDQGRIEQTKTEFENLEDAWRDWFAREGIAPFTITYDQLSSDPRGVLSDVLSALGHDPTVAQNVPVPTAKLSDATNRQWAQRFLSDTA